METRLLDSLGATVLSVKGLSVAFSADGRSALAVDNVTFSVRKGETLGVVGESGSGKSVTMLALMGLLPTAASVVAGEAEFGDVDLLRLPRTALRKIRGDRIGMVFQDPLTSLDPLMRVGSQIVEAIRVHNASVSRRAAKERAIALLALVGVPGPQDRFSQYPHEFSGGMRQRAMIAIAIANEPEVLIADEPTTALDVTVQAQVLEVLGRAQDETGAATILITHDLGVISEMCKRVVVMYSGRVAEVSPVEKIFTAPLHPYTRGLLLSLPRIAKNGANRLEPIVGSPPTISSRPSGCAFHPRCDLRKGRTLCEDVVPALRPFVEGRLCACHYAEEMGGTSAEGWSHNDG